MQSSAYVPLCVHFNTLKRGSLAMRSASRYFLPSFSSSAITHSEIQGITFPSKQSIDDLKTSSLFWIEKLIKLVSRSMWYGGPRAVLARKNRCEGSRLTWVVVGSAIGALASVVVFAFLRWSEREMIRLTWANLRVLRALV